MTGRPSPQADDPPTSRVSQILWFVGLWLAGLATVGSLAYVIRSILL